MAIANYIPGTNPYPASKQAEIEKLKAFDKEKGIKYTPPKPLTPVVQGDPLATPAATLVPPRREHVHGARVAG